MHKGTVQMERGWVMVLGVTDGQRDARGEDADRRECRHVDWADWGWRSVGQMKDGRLMRQRKT